MSMNIKAVLFDLDGTLLDYDLRTDFLPNYLKALGKYFEHDIHPDKLIQGIMLASDAIGNNDGSLTNEETFARIFYPYVNRTRDELEPEFTKFYRDIFPSLKKYAMYKPEAKEAVLSAFSLGCSVVIATNPYFPEIAVQQRLAWAGVANLPYRKVTTYENSHFAKPDPRYFQEIVDELECEPENCLVVGDEEMDMVAGTIGCQTYLVNSAATDEKAIELQPTFRGSLYDVKKMLCSLQHEHGKGE